MNASDLTRQERLFVGKLYDALGGAFDNPNRFVTGDKLFCMSGHGGTVIGDGMQALTDALNKAADRRIAITFDDSTYNAKGYKIEVNVKLGADMLDILNPTLIQFARQNSPRR